MKGVHVTKHAIIIKGIYVITSKSLPLFYAF